MAIVTASFHSVDAEAVATFTAAWTSSEASSMASLAKFPKCEAWMLDNTILSLIIEMPPLDLAVAMTACLARQVLAPGVCIASQCRCCRV